MMQLKTPNFIRIRTQNYLEKSEMLFENSKVKCDKNKAEGHRKQKAHIKCIEIRGFLAK